VVPNRAPTSSPRSLFASSLRFTKLVLGRKKIAIYSATFLVVKSRLL
jgi:hypothetical protein